jgi:hypothetical protein
MPDMKVIHVQPNSKRKIKALPVTGNYLIPESNGNFRWAEPNDAWRLYSTTGQQRCLIANLRFDDSEHSPDLWIYSVVKSDEVRPDEDVLRTLKVAHPEAVDGLFDDNRIRLDRSRKWYVRQFVDNPNKTGVRRFTGLPFNAWRAMWRKTISTDDIEIFGLGTMPNNNNSGNNLLKVRYAGLDFNVYMKWTDLLEDVNNSTTLLRHGNSQLRVSQIVMPWMQQHCRGGFIPFSDYDAMIPDEVDEVTYTIDVAGLS